MSVITDIKRRIQELGPAEFQEFCDTLISKHGFGTVHGYGMKAGTGKTTIGNPDSYFRKENGKYVFVAYTTQEQSIYTKLKEDIDKCLDQQKTGLPISEIDEIICCHTSSNLSAGDDKKLHDYCEKLGIALTIWGIDEIANRVYNRYRSMATELLGLPIDTNQILSDDDFVAMCDANGMSAPLDTIFQFREREKESLLSELSQNEVVIVTGKAGVGKTRLVLEVVRVFSIKNDYKLLCVKNKNLGLFNDLLAKTENPGSYIFFIDDANELAELPRILEYITKKDQGYNVKIIATVRDYVKAKLIDTIREYSLPKVVEIEPFSDSEIKEFLKSNLEIINSDYTEHIIRIAEGNPRIAYMAGRLAIEQQNLSAIKDASQLYDTYYGTYVNTSLGRDKDLCFVAGILSIINAVVLDDMKVLYDVVNSYGMTIDEFKTKVFELSNMEFVEIQLDQVAVFSDQCLSNYMLYYVFFSKKILKLSSVLELGYKHFRNGVIRSINIILNLFESSETRIYCKQEVLTAWDNLKKDNTSCYEKFVRDFHVFRPEEAFVMAQRKIERMDSEEYDCVSVDFSKNPYVYEENILEYLSGYQHSDQLESVSELLLDYSRKSNKTVVSAYRWLENNYGIGVSDYKYGYDTQLKISELFFDKMQKGDEVAMILGYQWAKYSLGFSFHPAEMGRGNTFVFYSLELKHSVGIDAYRGICWKMLNLLVNKKEWKNKILLFLDGYSKDVYCQPDSAIIASDAPNVEALLSAISFNSVHCLKIIKRLIMGFNEFNIKLDDNKWSVMLSGELWNLYQLLDDDFQSTKLKYEDYEKSRSDALSTYGKELSTSDISKFVKNLNSIFSSNLPSHDLYHVSQGLGVIVSEFGVSKLLEFLRCFIEYGNNISLYPETVVKPLNNNMDSTELLNIIKNASFSQKNEWMFSFFNSLPESKASEEMLDELLIFLKDKSDSMINSSSSRSLRLVDKFLCYKQDLYPIVSKIIFEKNEYNSFMVQTYFVLLFNEYEYSPQRLLDLFKDDVETLQKIYFYMIDKNQHTDLNGKFLIEFLMIDDSWIESYASLFWKHAENRLDLWAYRNAALWKSDNFIKYIDCLFYRHQDYDIQKWVVSSAMKSLVNDECNTGFIGNRKKEWIEHIVAENAKSDLVDVIFEFVCDLADDIRTKALQTLLKYNPDYELFEKIPITPKSWSGTGSLVPAFQKQIDYLESLNQIITGIKFMKHKLRIKQEIEMLQRMITKEEIDEICRNNYM